MLGRLHDRPEPVIRSTKHDGKDDDDDDDDPILDSTPLSCMTSSSPPSLCCGVSTKPTVAASCQYMYTSTKMIQGKERGYSTLGVGWWLSSFKFYGEG